MIISPPFLPERAAGQTEAQWLDAAMQPPSSRLPTTEAPEGAFPLSHNLAWHNGMHLQAPQANGADLAVRAIADGRVIFVQAPKAPNTDPDDPQNYNPFDRQGSTTPAWTDNGCVIVEHRTTIGATGDVETEVVFYSLSMHLASLARITPAGQTTARPLQAGDAIWRKDEIGRAGQIYGARGQIHFEISCDAANLQRLIGRVPGWVAPSSAASPAPAPTADGRVDAIFGSLYFYLPASTPVDAGAHAPAHPLRIAAPAATLQSPLWVKMTYDTGSCTFETFDAHGARIGAMPAEADAEYTLYQQATSRHGALTAAEQASSSPSGWYELLRFGRNIGRGPDAADKDPLPTNAAHWRRILGADGHAVWADLNAPGTFKFSDADFLPVMGWNCIDDDTNPQDQRCDSDHIKQLICDPDASNAERMALAQLERRLGNNAVQASLSRLFCKFPSEWDKATIDARYGFVKELDPFQQAPEAWGRLQAHLQGVCFGGLPSNYLDADWHVHPREFFVQMRKCGWLSLQEISQLIPRQHGTAANRLTAIPWMLSQARFTRYKIPLNITFRKYRVENYLRQAHFFAQTYIETAMWQTMEEFGRAHQQRRHDGTLYWPAPAMEYYQAFYGRGIMQLTWAGNYDGYGLYRDFPHIQAGHTYLDARISNVSRHYWSDPRNSHGQITQSPQVWAPRYDPSRVDQSPLNACDSGAYYWVSKNVGRGQININRVCDLGLTPAAVGRVSVLVNGGGYGFAERQAYAAYVFRFRGDSTDTARETSFTVTRGTHAVSVYVDFTPQRP